MEEDTVIFAISKNDRGFNVIRNPEYQDELPEYLGKAIYAFCDGDMKQVDVFLRKTRKGTKTMSSLKEK